MRIAKRPEQRRVVARLLWRSRRVSTQSAYEIQALLIVTAALFVSACLAPGRQLFCRQFRRQFDHGNMTITAAARPSPGRFVNGPYGLALDASGNLYVTTNSNTIEKFAPNGDRSRRLRQHRRSTSPWAWPSIRPAIFTPLTSAATRSRNSHPDGTDLGFLPTSSGRPGSPSTPRESLRREFREHDRALFARTGAPLVLLHQPLA